MMTQAVQINASTAAVGAAPISVAEVQEFMVHEAMLLDEWRLNEWLELLTEDARYLIPPLDKPDADYHTVLFLVADNGPTLRSRVRQLLGRTAWSENPRSRTRRLVTNFRIVQQADGEALISANFAVWRFQNGQTDTYVGRYAHRLIRNGAGGLLIKERRTVLDLETLRPHGKISFIL